MKKLMIGVFAFLVVVIAALFYVWTNLDSIVKEAIQTYGSQATKTAVRVGSVKMDLKNGQATIKGLRVANPAGFTDPNIFELGMISTKVDTSSLNKSPIIIDDIHISAPAVVYEINKSGVSNVEVMKKNLGVGGSPKSTSTSKKSIKMIIRKIVIDGSSAKVRIAALNKEQSVSLPRIVMTNVGQKSGGETASEIAAQLSSVMLNNVKGAVMKIGVSKYLGKTAADIKAQMQKQLGGAMNGSSDQIGNTIKGILGK